MIKKKKIQRFQTCILSVFRSFVRTTMMGRNSRECNLRWNKRVKSKDGWIVGRSGRSLQEARRLKKTRNRGGGRGRDEENWKRSGEWMREKERRSLDFNAIRNSSPPFITGRPSPPSPFLPTNEFTQYFVPSFNLVSLNFSFTFGASLLLKSR